MIKIGTYSDISSNYDEIWAIMRSDKQVPNAKNTLVKHVPLLSPSSDLFHKYLDLKSKGQWTREAFKTSYLSQFLTEMYTPAVFELLKELYIMSKTQNILLLCACKEESMCHRSIIAGILQGMYGDINIQSNDDCNYISYYYDFQAINASPLNTIALNTNHQTSQDTFYLIITGSYTYRDYSEFCNVTDFMLQYKVNQGFNISILTGADKDGTESFARCYARDKGYASKIFAVDWEKDKKAAGYRRADRLYNYISNYPRKNRGCLCFWDGRDKGLLYDIKMAVQCNAPVKVFDFNQSSFMSADNVNKLKEMKLSSHHTPTGV